jgi:hypothetical protein
MTKWRKYFYLALIAGDGRRGRRVDESRRARRDSGQAELRMARDGAQAGEKLIIFT